MIQLEVSKQVIKKQSWKKTLEDLSVDFENDLEADLNLKIKDEIDNPSQVHSKEPPADEYRHPTYDESSRSFSGTLSDTWSGVMSGVDDGNRTTYGADVVTVLIDDSQYCGIAYVGLSKKNNEDLLLSLLVSSCTFPFELKHTIKVELSGTVLAVFTTGIGGATDSSPTTKLLFVSSVLCFKLDDTAATVETSFPDAKMVGDYETCTTMSLLPVQVLIIPGSGIGIF